MLAAAPAHAAELSSSAKAEIDALLSGLGTSSCQFYRNGSWHSGSEAKDHLQMKLEYLVARGLITDSEDFIEKAGTKSSLSGRPYKVRCPNQPEEHAGDQTILPGQGHQLDEPGYAELVLHLVLQALWDRLVREHVLDDDAGRPRVARRNRRQIAARPDALDDVVGQLFGALDASVSDPLIGLIHRARGDQDG